jgi:hypothetical protein
MSQNEIILAVMQGCEKSRKNYMLTLQLEKSDDEVRTALEKWYRWTTTIDVLNEIFQSNLNPTRK